MKEARRVYDRAWRAERNALAGRVVRRRVPVERTAVALEQLRANGWSMRSIADWPAAPTQRCTGFSVQLGLAEAESGVTLSSA